MVLFSVFVIITLTKKWFSVCCILFKKVGAANIFRFHFKRKHASGTLPLWNTSLLNWVLQHNHVGLWFIPNMLCVALGEICVLPQKVSLNSFFFQLCSSFSRRSHCETEVFTDNWALKGCVLPACNWNASHSPAVRPGISFHWNVLDSGACLLLVGWKKVCLDLTSTSWKKQLHFPSNWKGLITLHIFPNEGIWSFTFYNFIEVLNSRNKGIIFPVVSFNLLAPPSGCNCS